MHQLNNLDVVILIIVGISALIALSRGLIKEVLSIIGWVLGIAAIVYLLPVFNPITQIYVKSGTMAGILTSIIILIVFLIIWIMLTGRIVGKIRTSKLSNIDRILGLFFGIARACLLVILFNILISWIIPQDKQSPLFKESKYFNLAGDFAAPIEKLIPEATLENIRSKTQNSDLLKEKDKEEKQENKESDDLFKKLAQPQIEKAKKKQLEKVKENFDGYNQHERDNLDRLIENAID